MVRELSFTMHGVTTCLVSDRPELIEPTEMIFGRYLTAPADAPKVRVNITHADNFWGRDGNPTDADAVTQTMERIGRRVYVREETTFVSRFVRYDGLVGIHHCDDTSDVFDLIYDDVYLASAIGQDPFQSGHQLFGIWPIAVHLAKRRNMFFLHGGAVTSRGRNIAFCGLQGVGKSTLLMRMLRDAEAKFLSDNIYFYDDQRVYACPETVRIDDASLAFIEPPPDLLVDTRRNSDLGRKMYVVNPARTAENLRPDVFIVPRFHPERSEMSPAQDDVPNLFTAFGELAMELHDYDQWAAPFLLRHGAFATRRLRTLEALLQDKPVYHLYIRKGDSPDDLINRIHSIW